MAGFREEAYRPVEGTTRVVARRSYLVGPLAVVLLVIGLLLGTYTVLIPALLGLFLLSAAGSFLSARLNPFSMSFYIPTKPSWMAIAVVGLTGLLLLSAAYSYWRTGAGPVIPHGWVP